MQNLRTVIVASRSDPASLSIAENLINHHGFTTGESRGGTPVYRCNNLSLIIIDKECIYAEPEDIPVQGSSIIFASKHRSAAGRPALTVHTTGNLTREAEYGGGPEEISMVEPFRIREALSTMIREKESARSEIEVTMEATHHGPTSFPVPVCFVEIGSTPDQWSDPVLGRIASRAVIASANSGPTSWGSAVGFGGTHYSTKLTKMCTEGTHAIGHIVPKHAFDSGLSEWMILNTFRKTVGGCKTAVVDWKGLKGEHRRRVLDLLSNSNVEVVRC